MKPLAFAFAVAFVLLLTPTTSALSLILVDANVDVDATGDVWNVASTADARIGVVWVPPDARLHRVFAVVENGTEVAAPWRAEGVSGLRISAPANATRVGAEFDVRPNALLAVDLVAPADYAHMIVTVNASQDLRIEGDGVHTLHAGDALRIRLVDPARLSETWILAIVAGSGVLILLAGLAWHALRPPRPREWSQMRFLDHLAELQARLMPPVIAFGLLNVVYFIPIPRLADSIAALAYDAVAQRLVPAGVELVALRPVDAVLAQVQVALFLSFAATVPLLLYEIAAFVGPALEKKERGLARRLIPLVTLLFGVGALFGYLVMAPLMIRALYSFAPAVGARAFLVVSDLVGFALVVVASFALAFELPVAMFVLSRLGLVKAKTWRKYLRHAIVVIVLVAGIITPDPSVVSQLLVAIPVTGLYLAGMVGAAVAERRRPHRGS